MEGLLPDRSIIFIITLLASLSIGAIGQQDACSTANRVADLAGCLSEIRQVAQNDSYFWFGSVAVAKCQGPLKYTPNCFNLHSGVKSLAELAFGVQNFDLSSVDRYPDIKYTTLPGTYDGCDNRYERVTTAHMSVDPTSDMSYPAWDLRGAPETTWESSEGDLYTLIFIDAGNGWLHQFTVNIPGSNVSQGNHVDSYHGPMNGREVPNVYAFLLFKQNTTIDASNIYLPPFTRFNVSYYVETYNLGELVGLSWVLAHYDAYSVTFQSAMGIRQNCADLVSKAYESHKPRPFLPDPLTLSVYLRLRISHNGFSYDCGSETRYQPAADFYVNPIGLPILSTADTSSMSTRTFSLQMNKVFPNNTADFEGKLYSLLVVDPDIPSSKPFVGDNERPLLHGLTINIQGDDVASGNPIKPYFGPKPPDGKAHIYYFLLYEQKAILNMNNTVAYSAQGHCSGYLAESCLFNVTSFVSSNNLTLVGATWLSATTDDYVTCSQTTAGAPIVVTGPLLYLLALSISIGILNPLRRRS